MTKKIPFFNYAHVFGQYKNEIQKIILDISERGSFILQQEGINFEKNLSDFTNSKYALGVGNCTDGLLLSIKAAGIGRGDEVIFSSHTFVATASAIYHSGATPIPVECGADHLIDINSIESAITSKTKAIIPTQLNGHVCDMDQILKICKKYNLLLLEDAAQSLGAKFKGKSAGTFGLSGSFSFYPAKVVGCFGDGGGVITNSKEIYEKIFLTRDHGRAKIGEIVTWGMNSRLDNLQAAILDFKLSKYQLDIKRRREIATMYEEGLNSVKEIVLPRAPDSNKDKYEIYQNYEIEVVNSKMRASFREFLLKNNIGTILQWGGKAVHEFEGLNFNISLPYTEDLMRRSLLIPMNTSLSDEDIMYIIEKIRKYFGYGS